MSGHLPECIAWHQPPEVDIWGPFAPCICGRLRACEQRVLNEAREAVAASSDHYDLCICDECCGTEAALAAIDALRGSGNPHTPPSAEKGEQA